MSIEAMKQALEALDAYSWEQVDAATKALRQAIEQAEKQEPLILDRGCYERGCCAYDERDGDGVIIKQAEKPCKTGSQCIGGKCPECEREWVGLTDEEIEECKINGGLPHAINWRLSAKVLQAKLKEKNGG